MNPEEMQFHDSIWRSRLYAILASAFLREPDSGVIRFFQQPDTRSILQAFSLSMDESFVTTPAEVLAENLATEYTRLFLAPPTHLPPFESCYVGGVRQDPETFEPSLRGRAAREVETFYFEHGITLPDGDSTPPDHIGLELDALRLFCEREAEEFTAGRKAQARHIRRIAKRFLTEHPIRWVPSFCDRILGSTPAPFFRIIAQLTGAFLISESEALFCPGKEGGAP